MCSGVMSDGSLRIVRNGIGMIEQASVELPGIKGMWNLRATNMDAFDKYLVLSFVGETRVLAINEDDELDEAELAGFNSQSQVGVRRLLRSIDMQCTCESIGQVASGREKTLLENMMIVMALKGDVRLCRRCAAPTQWTMGSCKSPAAMCGWWTLGRAPSCIRGTRPQACRSTPPQPAPLR